MLDAECCLDYIGSLSRIARRSQGSPRSWAPTSRRVVPKQQSSRRSATSQGCKAQDSRGPWFASWKPHRRKRDGLVVLTPYSWVGLLEVASRPRWELALTPTCRSLQLELIISQCLLERSKTIPRIKCFPQQGIGSLVFLFPLQSHTISDPGPSEQAGHPHRRNLLRPRRNWESPLRNHPTSSDGPTVLLLF